MNNTGALKTVGSSRIYDFESISTIKESDLPEEYIVTNKPDVLDQGFVNSCVAHAIVECLQANLIKDKKEDTDLSVLMIYGLWRNHHFEGMFPETTINLGREKGTTLRRLAPGNLEVPDAIKKALEYEKEYPNSLGFKVGNYFKVRKNEDFALNIKRGIYQFDLPLLMIWECSLGRHAEIIVGWTKEGKALCQNSWGEAYGNQGLHSVNFDSLEEAYLILMDNVKLPFKDVEGHWAEKYIRNLYFANLFSGYEDGTFKPDSPITRGEVAKLIDMVMKANDEKIKALEKELQELKKEK